MTKSDFEKMVRDAARAHDRSKDDDDNDGLLFWIDLREKHPELTTCRCHKCRGNPWDHARGILSRYGFRA